jgi:hypothetical protein
VAPTRLLRLDVVDFRELATRQSELLQMIEAENARRTAPPAREKTKFGELCSLQTLH